MNAIGGYFELELSSGKHYHEQALKLNTARNAFEYVLRVRKYKKVFMPYYTCEVMLQPLEKLNISYEFYHITPDLEPVDIPILNESEAFLYTNYFGLKQDCVQKLAGIYQNQLIIDNSQAFFAPRIDNIDTFYSARKFLGVADGAYLYIDKLLEENLSQDKSYNRMLHLLQRIDEGAEFAYSTFQKNEDFLSHLPMRMMSHLTDRILRSIDYEHVINKRRENFIYLFERLSSDNLLKPCLSESSVPMMYPFWREDIDFKPKLISKKIFVPTYWPNVMDWCKKSDFEYFLVKNLLAIPIDQRYGKSEMDMIIKELIEF